MSNVQKIALLATVFLLVVGGVYGIFICFQTITNLNLQIIQLQNSNNYLNLQITQLRNSDTYLNEMYDNLTKKNDRLNTKINELNWIIGNFTYNSDEENTLDSVASKITVNGKPLISLNPRILNMLGGFNPYPWDLWKARGIIRYYFIEDLLPERTDNYRDAVIGVSLLYPASEDHRNYTTGKIVGEPYILNVCIYVTTEGSTPEKVMYNNQIVCNYPGVPDGVVDEDHPGYCYCLFYTPINP